MNVLASIFEPDEQAVWKKWSTKEAQNKQDTSEPPRLSSCGFLFYPEDVECYFLRLNGFLSY
jgi:hypothetical protein